MRKLPAAAQEERRRQVIGLRQAGLTYGAIAAQVGLTQTGVFDICKRYAERGAAGLKTGQRGPDPGYGRGVVQNLPFLGDTSVRKAPAYEGRIATGRVSCVGGCAPPRGQACWG